MKNIKTIIKRKPSIALKFAVAGLKRLNTKSKYEINMTTYGNFREGVCSGCAATAAIQELSGHDFSGDEIYYRKGRAKAIDVNIHALELFEDAMDDTRIGSFTGLVKYCTGEFCTSFNDHREILPVGLSSNISLLITYYNTKIEELQLFDL